MKPLVPLPVRASAGRTENIVERNTGRETAFSYGGQNSRAAW